MRYIRSLIAVAAVAVLLLVAAGVALAMDDWGWWWNAQVDVEGTVVKTEWTVDEGFPLDAADDYKAKITITLPEGADAEILSQAYNETVILKSDDDLECTTDGVEAKFKFKVTPLEPVEACSDHVVEIALNVNGQWIAMSTGVLNESIVQPAVISAVNPSCG